MVEFETGVKYKIMSVRSGRVLDIPKENINSGAHIHQWHYDKEDNQLWNMYPSEDNCYIIMSAAKDGLCLEISGLTDNTIIRAGNYFGVETQKFRFEPIDGSNLIFKIISKQTGYIFAVEGASVGDKADVVQTFSDENGQNVQWIVTSERD